MRVSKTSERLAARIAAEQPVVVHVSESQREAERRRSDYRRLLYHEGCLRCAMERFGSPKTRCQGGGGLYLECLVVVNSDFAALPLTDEEREIGEHCPLIDIYDQVMALEVTEVDSAVLSALRPTWRPWQEVAEAAVAVPPEVEVDAGGGSPEGEPALETPEGDGTTESRAKERTGRRAL